MMRKPTIPAVAAFAILLAGAFSAATAAEGEATKIELADGKVELTAPANWEQKQPRVRIIDYEFNVPAAEGEEETGRVTVMGAGGSVEANINRWMGQFEQPDGQATQQRTKTEELKVDEQAVHVIDITGTFKDQRGPFAPATMRENYRMLAAIISTDELGQYFIKFTGPNTVVAANEEAFQKMVKSLNVKN